ncbi:hypothetical protein O988_00278 [Pseudogymnoascus sp. VKM F-3808]|nr:hypothetical protein O988_00278 [Pseudogymnoascus sp. VKM F-3808]
MFYKRTRRAVTETSCRETRTARSIAEPQLNIATNGHAIHIGVIAFSWLFYAALPAHKCYATLCACACDPAAAILPSKLSTPPPPPTALSKPTFPRSNDLYAPNETSTSIDKSRQLSLFSQQARHSPSPSSASARTLRRTPNLESLSQANSLQRRTHIEAVSVGITPSPSPSLSSDTSPPHVRFAEAQKHQAAPQEAAGLPNEQESYAVRSKDFKAPDEKLQPHNAVRINRHRAAAILYTLEEALRHPTAFTPVWEEENASMSDLPVGGASAYAGNGRPNNGSMRPSVPQPTGSPGGLRGPKQIMIERQAREEKKRAAAEAELQRQRQEEEQRVLEERRISDERRATAAGGGGGARGSGGGGGQRISDNSQRSNRTSGGRVVSGDQGNRAGDASLQGRGTGGTALGGGDPAAARRAARAAAQSGGAPPASQDPAAQPEQRAPLAEPAVDPLDSVAQGKRNTGSTFPHAFERWETLSAHWEGLTSYWIRRLEENTIEIQRDPISSQLSRQVTDLSAAGANLFHAVVELQRLRASSERKFQRWFFDTRAEQEKMAERQGMLDSLLQSERQGRAAAIQAAVQKESEKNNSEKLVNELKRELQISKEEARRAWEELGRREQEERERTASLRDGQPTLVGGVQVVPMMQGAPSRHTSNAQRERPATREGPYPGGPTAASMGGQQDPEELYSQSVRARQTDPFVESRSAAPATSGGTASTRQQTSSSASATTSRPHPPSSNSTPTDAHAPAIQQIYQQQTGGTILHPADSSDIGTLSEEEYEIDPQGQFRRDARGNKIPYQRPLSDADSEDERVVEARAREQAHLAQYGRIPTTSGDYPPRTSAAAAMEPVDYSGQSYGSESGWDRHQHPTRLSDVLEEDERSRTSASQVAFDQEAALGELYQKERTTLRARSAASNLGGVQGARRAFSKTAMRPARTVEEAKSRYKSGPFSWKAGVIFLASGASLIFYFRYEKARMERARIAEAAKGVGRPKVGGPFTLVDHDGKPYTEENLRGKYSLVYFGFTHCPDICPEELDKMASMIDLVEAKQPGTMVPVFITCDPARDTPAVVKEYLAEFHPRLVGLTGTWDQVKDVCKKYRVYFSTPQGVKPGQDYLVDHSIYFYLMDPEGDFVEAIGRQHSPTDAARIILDHIGDYRGKIDRA